MPSSSVLVLGGGVGGLVTANRLRRRLDRDHRVVLIDREAKHVFSPSLLWLIVGRRKPEAIVRDLARLERKGIEVVTAEVESLDPEAKTVRAGGKEIGGDHVVVSLGAALAPENVPGLAEAGHNLYSLEGATRIRDLRTTVTDGRIVVLIAGMPFKCPAAPYEAAMLLEDDAKKRKVRDRVEIAIYTPEAGPMGVAGPEFSAGVRAMIEQRGIDYFPRHQVTEVDPAGKKLIFAEGAEAPFDLLVYVPPHVAPAVVKESGLTGDSGWVPVDRHTMETSHSDVYAIGDVTSVPLSMGLPLPKAGVFAHHQAEAVAKTIAHKITGRGETDVFDGSGSCFVEVGGGKAGFGSGNFYAEPNPTIRMHQPSWRWHAGKVILEKSWLWRWF